MVFAEFQPDAIGYDRALPYGDVGERPGVDKHGLAFDGLDEVGVHRFRHPGGHGAVHLQIGGGHGLAVPVPREDDPAHAPAQVFEILGYSQNGHDFGRNGDIKARAHHEAVGLSPHPINADDHVAQGLTAEIHHPAHVHAGGIDVEAFHAGEPQQGFVVVVALVLHPRRQGDHGQIVRVHHRVDVAREAERILGQRDALGKSAPGGRTLDAHRRPARRLANGRGAAPAAPPQPLHKPDGGGGLALTKRRRRDRGDVHILAVRVAFKAGKHGTVVDFAHVVAVGQKLAFFQAEFPAQGGNGFHPAFGVPGDFPVRMLFRVQSHARVSLPLEGYPSPALPGA